MKKRLVELGLLIAIMILAVYVRSEYILDKDVEKKYLLGYDPYYHYRVANYILENGERPEWDTIANAPYGQPLSHPPLFHYYLAYTYKIFDIFSNRSFFDFAVYSNIILIILTVIIAFLTGKALTNDVGGVFTASLFAVSNAVVKRSVIGFTDTDLFVVFFSFLITFFWIKAVKNIGLKNKRTLFSILCGFSIFLYCITWSGYFYMLSLVLAATVLLCIIGIIKTKKICFKEGEILVLSLLGFFVPYTLYKSQYLYFLALLVITSLILLFEFKIKIEAINKINKNAIYVIGGIVLIVTSLVIYKQGVIKIIIPFGKYSADNVLNVGGILYPTTEVSIRELYQTDIRVLYSLFSFGLILAPMGIVLSIWKDRKYSYAIYLILFIIGTYSMLVKGGRFSLIMAVPIIIGTGLFFGKIYEIINEKIPKKKIVSVGVISMIILSPIILVPAYLEADKNNSGQREITDEWWEALNWINENTPEDATIVTWWDFGYWIEAIGKRKTTMNGGHYNINARLVKTGNLFNTQSELVAMKEIYGFDVNCTKEEALEDLEGVREWSKDSKLARKEKLKEMQKYADDNAYVIVDEKMASIYSWISYYGSWDYNKGKGEKTPIYKFYLVNMRQIPDGVEYIYKSGETLIDVIQDYNNNFHASLIRDNKIIPLTGTLFDNNGKKNLLINRNGTLGIAYLSDIRDTVKSEGGVVYYNTPKVLYLIEPEGVSKMFSRLMFFDGANLSYFELVQSFGSVKIYKVYKEPQENLNEDINYGEDEFFKKMSKK